MPSIAGQSTAFASAPMHLEHLLEPLHVGLGFVEMRQEALLELLVGRLLGHLRQRLHELLLGIIDVLQLVHEQIVHGFDVFGKKSHCAGSLIDGTRRANRLSECRNVRC